MKVTIDGQLIELEERLTILQAAKVVGIEIPTMCYMEGYDPFTSCMMCTVEDLGSGKKVPACTAKISDGMEIATQSAVVQSFRKRTLELLLSDHVGDCEAPCRRGCGVDMDIPRMIREIMDDDHEAAIATVRRDMAIPAVLERFCHGPCETPCRRGKYDEPIAIRHLARHAADQDLERDEPFVPERDADSGKRIAIVGAGPTGLSAAYYLALKGHACTVYEKGPRAFERLYGMGEEDALPDWVVEGELRVLSALGVDIRFGHAVDSREDLALLISKADAVLLAHGVQATEVVEVLGLDMGKKGLLVDKVTGMTSQLSVFAAGNVVKADERVIKSAASAKSVALVMDQFLRGAPVIGLPNYYDHTMGKLLEGEIETFVAGASDIPRRAPEDVEVKGLDRKDAYLEATRCMHCDCREKFDCKLRIYSDEYDASQKTFRGGQRATYEHVNQDAGAVYESGKCIKCGLCVHVTRAEGEPFGFAFVGRGFDLKTTVSLGKSLPEGLQKVAAKVVEACPTGALSKNEKQTGCS